MSLCRRPLQCPCRFVLRTLKELGQDVRGNRKVQGRQNRRKSDEAKNKADEIINEAKDKAQKMMTDAEREIENYEKQLQFLSLQKQQFVKNTVSLLFDFGKIMDQAQQEIDDEISSMPGVSAAQPVNAEGPQEL